MKPHAESRPTSGLSAPLSRRGFLSRGSAVAVATAVGLPWISACSSEESVDAAQGGKPDLTIATWDAYIDSAGKNADVFASGTTLGDFTGSTRLKVDWRQDFNSNEEYWTQHFEPVLSAHRDLGIDIVMPTFWLAARLLKRGWLEEIPIPLIPNRANLDPAMLKVPFDKGAAHHLPWQSGLTGIAYNADKITREVRSFSDLFAEEFRGRVSLLNERSDVLGALMLTAGNDPSVVNIPAANAAIEALERSVADGQVRAFVGTEFTDKLISGEVDLAMAWSGDIAQITAEHPNIKFVVPEEGAMLWFDTMIIPKGAKQMANAAKFMDFVYDIENAARITEFIQYITPVQGVREYLEAGSDDQKRLAEDPLIFPDDATRAQLHTFAALDEGDDIALDYRFNKLISS